LHKKLEKLCIAQKIRKIVHCTKNQKNCAQKFEKIVHCTKNQKICAQKFKKIVHCTKNQKNCALHKKSKKLCIAQKFRKIVHYFLFMIIWFEWKEYARKITKCIIVKKNMTYQPPRLYRTLSLHDAYFPEISDVTRIVNKMHRIHSEVTRFINRMQEQEPYDDSFSKECTSLERKLNLYSPHYQNLPFDDRLQRLLDNADGQLSQCQHYYEYRITRVS
jgi:hypothetical protein